MPEAKLGNKESTARLVREYFSTPHTLREAEASLEMSYYTIRNYLMEQIKIGAIEPTGEFRDKARVFHTTYITNPVTEDNKLAPLIGIDGSKQAMSVFCQYWLAPPDQRITKTHASINDFFECGLFILDYIYRTAVGETVTPIEKINVKRRLESASINLKSTIARIEQLLGRPELWSDDIEVTGPFVTDPSFPSREELNTALANLQQSREGQ